MIKVTGNLFLFWIILQQPPSIETVPVTVREGDEVVISEKEIIVTDEDTLISDLVIFVKEHPSHGKLLLGGEKVEEFRIKDIQNQR